MSSDKRALMKSALRQSRRNRNWMGYWLHKQRIREKLKVSEQSRQLAISVSQLVSLSMCMTPRHEHFPDDLHAICQECHVSATLLANLIRKEWALIKTQQSAKPPSSQTGWLMAASETPPPATPESHEPT